MSQVSDLEQIKAAERKEWLYIYAGHAMQGFIASNTQGIPMTGEEVARRSLGCAKALLAELEKDPNA